jgi:16S rRNA (cytosine1402-N4)-methyltransferase
MPYKHVPAMLKEVIHFLDLKPGKTIVDGTLGGAGHSKAICEKIFPTGILIGIDQDGDAIENAKQVLSAFAPNIHLIHDNFVHLAQILKTVDIDTVDGILLDLGLSLHHIESSRRGFSFKRDEPLDMRMNITTKTTAEDLVNEMDQSALARLFRTYGEEKWAGPIAKRILRTRQRTRIKTSGQLSDIVCGVIPGARRRDRKIHPATKVFMSLRIAVNRELEILEAFMDDAVACLSPGGRLCVLSYHSLEDRIMKTRIRELEKGCTCPPDFPYCTCNKKPTVRRLIKKILKPTEEEVRVNPMSRSAKLRVIEKIRTTA